MTEFLHLGISANLLRENDVLREENTKLRKLVARMSRALTVDGNWCDESEYYSIVEVMQELGVKGDER